LSLWFKVHHRVAQAFAIGAIRLSRLSQTGVGPAVFTLEL